MYIDPCQHYMHWPGGTKEYLTGLLLTRLLRMLYTHWMMYPSRACTLPTPLIVTLCSVLLWTVYIAPVKSVSNSWPLSTVPLCIQFGSERISLCLQMRVSWSEQGPPWSSRETLKAGVSSVQRHHIKSIKCSTCACVHTYMHISIHTYTCILQGDIEGWSKQTQHKVFSHKVFDLFTCVCVVCVSCMCVHWPTSALHALTRRDEGVLDSIAPDEVAPQYAVHTLNDVSVKSCHIAHSTDCHCVLYITPGWVHHTREGRAKELTSLSCPIVYPVWVRENITVSTDEGELVWTVSSLELQGDIEGSCEQCTKSHINSIKCSTCTCVHTYMHVYAHMYTCTLLCSRSSLGAPGRHWRLERANTTQSILSQFWPVYMQ